MKVKPKRSIRPGALVMLALAIVAALLASCGGTSSSSNGGVADLGSSAGSSTATADGAASPGSTSPEAALLALAKCMRANGVPNFPDPTGGGFRLGPGMNPSSPAFKAAHAKCNKFLLGGGPGSGPPPSAQTLARFLNIARCMRQHGISDFPDPKTSVPANLPVPSRSAGTFVISDIEGVILVFRGIDTQSPAFTRAAAVCSFPLHNH